MPSETEFRTAQQLNTQHQRLLEGRPPTCHVEIPGRGDVLFCHATPRTTPKPLPASSPMTADDHGVAESFEDGQEAVPTDYRWKRPGFECRKCSFRTFELV